MPRRNQGIDDRWAFPVAAAALGSAYYSTRVRSARSRSAASRRRLSRPRRSLTWTGSAFKSPVPKTTKVKLKWVDHITLTSASGVMVQNRFQCNDIYKPNYEVGPAHQPKYYDEMKNLYDQYCVVAARLRVSEVIVDTSNTAPFIWGVIKTARNATVVSSYAEYENVIEAQRGFKSRWRNSMSTSQLSNERGGVLSASPFSVVRDLGIRNPLAESSLNVAFDTTPGEGYFWQLWLQGASSGVTVPAIPFIVEIEYDVICSEPTRPVLS